MAKVSVFMKSGVFAALLLGSAMLFSPRAAASDDWHEHPNHVALFAGVTADSEHTLFTLGADYERRLSDLFGAGVIADFALENPKHQIYAGALFIHPVPNLKFVLAPGLEHKSAHELEEAHSAFLFRVGAGYDFHVGSVSISPTVNLDLTSGHAAGVFGVSLGTGF